MITSLGRWPGLVALLSFFFQFLWVGFVYSFGLLTTFFPMGILVALTARKQATHPIPGHATSQAHDAKYVSEGASGFWEYWASPIKWLNLWNNYEDGTLGEPSGKTSARCKGAERTKWNQFLWICRNPFNTGKRTSSFFACFINDCVVTFWGDYNLSDKEGSLATGWHLVKAVHKKTGKVYYGFRLVKQWSSGKVFQVKAGFKIKPGHADEVQDVDDLDKAFTFNIHFASEPS